MKGRENSRTYKLRQEIKPEYLNLFYKRKIILNLKFIQIMNLLKNLYLIVLKKFIVKRLVDYNRTPFINKSGLYFRLTFDKDILSTKKNSLFNKDLEKDWKECIAGYTILEVKFNSSIPPWFQRIIQNYQLRLRSISKFVIASDTQGIASDHEGK